MNIRFEYLYRDAGNFKNRGEVIFSNPDDIDAELVAAAADSSLIDRAYFAASKVGAPDLRFLEHIDELDHGWHEADSLQTTNEEATDKQHRSMGNSSNLCVPPPLRDTSLTP